MYNLFVSGDGDQWKRNVCEYSFDRVIDENEYTIKTIANKYGKLDDNVINEIKRFPCLFIYEGALNKDAKVGQLHKITRDKGIIRVEYEFFDVSQRISAAKIEKLMLELNIKSKFELNRHHWAIKDVDLLLELKNVEILSKELYETLKLKFNKSLKEFTEHTPNDKKEMNLVCGEASAMRIKKIFISHASADKTMVDSFVHALLRNGMNIHSDDIFCTSIDGMDIKTGDDFRTTIADALRNAEINIMLISGNYKKSEMCQNEMGAIWCFGKNPKPLILDDVTYESVGVICKLHQIAKINSTADLDKLYDEKTTILNINKNVTVWNQGKERFLNEYHSKIEKIKAVSTKIEKKNYEIVTPDIKDGWWMIFADGRSKHLWVEDLIKETGRGSDNPEILTITHEELQSKLDSKVKLKVVRTGPITNTDIWIIKNGRKTWVTNPTQLLKIGYSGTQDSRIEYMEPSVLNELPDDLT